MSILKRFFAFMNRRTGSFGPGVPGSTLYRDKEVNDKFKALEARSHERFMALLDAFNKLSLSEHVDKPREFIDHGAGI
jgi:hypothetical protein